MQDTSLGVYVSENFTLEDTSFNKIRVEKLLSRANASKSKLNKTEGSGSVVFSIAYVPVVIDVTQDTRIPVRPALTSQPAALSRLPRPVLE